MVANLSNTLVDKLKKHMRERNIKVPQLQMETGLPRDRVYKWFKNNPKIKHEDAEIIEKWISGTMEDVPMETKDGEPIGSIGALQSLADGNKVLYEANRTLADSNKNLSEANKKLADAHFILAEGNRELITIFKDFISRGISLPEAMKTQILPPDPGTNRGSEGFRPAASGKTKNAGR
jgi:hypothetical protein